ncbi:prepilin-type N-terminal cleavage/methylation domain-containing protein [Vulcaniibacterium tengchongense]|uniref:Prepilin-type N-terminal cleavage/methylation domain-containing protein n=1 Tax=Vulcaniibacterium tengchongense TaxID=1273429 RepID=A0A3N4W0F4_9GAMM|nr:prepilin-type N-terminal cleavage/methylation domain-containing protein [Vulcaniibacterium tengchongense]
MSAAQPAPGRCAGAGSAADRRRPFPRGNPPARAWAAAGRGAPAGVYAARSPRPASGERASRAAVAARRQRGYTLIEVIVAFALLALALTLLLGTLSGAARQVRWSGDAGRAALYAQSLLDQVGVGEPVVAGERAGELEQGRYRWRLRITPWQDPVLAATGAPVDPTAARLFELTLGVEWGEAGPGQRLQLRSLRLVPADAQAVPP